MKLLLFLLLASPLIGGPREDAAREKLVALRTELAAHRAASQAIDVPLRQAGAAVAQVKRVHDQAAQEVGAASSELRKIDQKLARLLPLFDLGEAKQKYERAGKTDAAYRELFQTVRGIPPDNTEVKFRISEFQIIREMQVKTLVAISPALFELADLVLQITNIAFEGVGFGVRDLNAGADLLDDVKDIVESAKEQINQLAGDPLGQIDEIKEDLLEKILGPDAKGAVDLLRKKVPKQLQDEADSAWLDPAAAKDEAKKMAEELNAMARKQLYGVEDRAAAERETRAYRDSLTAKLDALRPRLTALRGTLSEAEGALRTLESQKRRIDDRLRALSEEARAAEDALAEARLDERIAAELKTRPPGKGQVQSLALSVGGAELAVDAVTASLLGMPRALPFRISATLAREATAKCQFVKDGKTVTTTVRVVEFPDPDPDADGARLASANLSVSGKRSLSAQRAGALTAQFAASGVKVSSRSHPCGSEQFLESTEVRSREVAVGAYRVKDVEWRSEPASVMAAGRADFFFTSSDGASTNTIRLRPIASVEGPKGTEQRTGAGDSCSATLAGSAIATLSRHGHEIHITPVQGVGKATVQLGVLSSGGLEFPKKLEITSNRLRHDVELGAGGRRTFADGDELLKLPAGVPATFRVIAEGPGDLSNHRVDWQVSASSGISAKVARSSKFVRAGEGWVAETQVTLAADQLPPDLRTRSFTDRAGSVSVSAAVLAPDGARMASFGFPQVQPQLPPIVDIELVLAEAGGGAVPIIRKDIFFPRAAKSTVIPLAVQATVQGGGKTLLPLSFTRAELEGPAARQLSLAGNGLLPPSNPVGSEGTGTGTVRATFDKSLATPHGLVVNPDVLDDTLLVTLNHFAVSLSSGGKNLRCRMFGPAEIPGFRARWRLQPAIERTTDFALSEGQWTTETPADRPFIEVAILNAAGLEVARISGTLDQKPLPDPEVAIDLPDEAEPGQKVIVRANVTNLDFREGGSFVLLWEVDPSVGTFSNPETRIPSSSTSTASMANTLSIRPDAKFDGQTMPITVRVMRLIGGGRP